MHERRHLALLHRALQLQCALERRAEAAVFDALSAEAQGREARARAETEVSRAVDEWSEAFARGVFDPDRQARLALALSEKDRERVVRSQAMEEAIAALAQARLDHALSMVEREQTEQRRRVLRRRVVQQQEEKSAQRTEERTTHTWVLR